MSKTAEADYAGLIEKLWVKADEIDNGGPFYSKSEIYRNSANALTSLIKERDELKEALVEMLDEYDGVYDRSGTFEGRAPYQSERAKEACGKARAALASAPGENSDLSSAGVPQNFGTQ